MSVKILTTTNPGGGATTVVVTFYASTATQTPPSQLVTVGNFPTGNKRWSRGIQVNNSMITIRRGANAFSFLIDDLVALAVTQEPALTYAPNITTQPANATSAATAAATGTLTSDNTNVTAGETVVIGGKTYTFKAALTPTEGEILIGANADATLLNLIRAINHTGTPGTDYQCSAANTQVTAASSVTSHAFTVAAINSGCAGNLIATTETSAHLTWGASTLTGGTVAASNMSVVSSSEITATYQWQYSTDGTTWNNCTGTVNGCAYTNGTTATLTCTPTTTGQTGVSHRCVVTNSQGSTTSNEATLNIP